MLSPLSIAANRRSTSPSKARRPSIDPSGHLASSKVPVAIMIGSHIDDSATPPTYERNRFVTDLVLHYACAPFFSANAEALQACVSSADSPHHSQFAVHDALPKQLPAELLGLDMWHHEQPDSDIFCWYADPFPTVDIDTLTDFHDANYIKYLSVRETLSDVDERETSAKRARAEGNQPAVSRRSSVTNRPSDVKPMRELSDLIPIQQDDTYSSQNAAPFLGMWRTIQATVSGTLTAVRWLLEGPPPGSGGDSTYCGGRLAALHWFGGRHHAERDAASGFCYVNDVVLAAMALRRGLPEGRSKVLVVDVDAHHGDGTQAAFLHDPNIYTLSVHGYGTGFFPGSGHSSETGKGLGKGSAANIPLPEGASDALFVPLARCAIRRAVHHLGEQLGAIILVCGADGIQGDPLGRLNYSIGGLQCVVRLIIESAVAHNAKLLILGGGGYTDTTAARVAAVVTRDVLSSALVMQKQQGPETDMGKSDLFMYSPYLIETPGAPVPDSCEFFTRYGPSFLMPGAPPPIVPHVGSLQPNDPLFAEFTAMRSRRSSRVE